MSDDLSPGAEAVAALYETEPGTAVVVFIGPEGTVEYQTGVSPKRARRIIDRAVDRAIDNIEEGERSCSARRIQGGAWAVRLRCPDGVTRRFAERRSSRAVTRSALSPSVRWDILARSGFRCRYCGKAAPAVELHVDHVTPVVLGGEHDPANLVVACIDCNLGKGSRALPEVS